MNTMTAQITIIVPFVLKNDETVEQALTDMVTMDKYMENHGATIELHSIDGGSGAHPEAKVTGTAAQLRDFCEWNGYDADAFNL